MSFIAVPAAMIGLTLADKGAQIIVDKVKEKKWEEKIKVQESMMNKAMEDVNKKIKTLHEALIRSQKSTENEVQTIRGDLENQGKKEEQRSRELESMLGKKLRLLSKKIHTLEEEVKEWPETTKHEVQLIRGDLEKQGKKEEERSRELESVLDKKFVQLSQNLHTLEEEVKEWPETTKREVQIIRGDLENQGKKVEKTARELESMMDKKFGQLSQKIQTLEEEVKEWPEITMREVQIIRGDLEKQGKKVEERSRELESVLDNKLQELSINLQTLEEEVKELPETTKREVQIIRAELENQGMKEEQRSRELESMLNKLQELSQKIHTLEEEVKEWPETTKREVQRLRAELENQGMKEEQRSRELESMMDHKFGLLSQKFHTLEEEVQELQETIKYEVQLLRAELENQGKKMDECSMALQHRMDMLVQHVSQGFRTLEQALQSRQQFQYLEFLLFQAYLENNQGIAMLQEEIIRRVLELAGGERINNIWTDSRCAFGIGPAQGPIWNRRLREAQGAEGIDGPLRHALGFSWRNSTGLSLPPAETDKDLLACGGHVSYREDFGTTVGGTVPGASHHLHCNQDQGAESLDPSLSSEEGPRSLLESDTRRQ